MTQKIPFILLVLLILFACGSLVLNLWLLSKRNSFTSSQNKSMETPQEKTNFFESFLGYTESELVSIDKDQLTFKNKNGVSLPFQLTSSSTIIFNDGVSTSSANQLKIGSKVLLTARITKDKSEIASIHTPTESETVAPTSNNANQSPPPGLAPVVASPK